MSIVNINYKGRVGSLSDISHIDFTNKSSPQMHIHKCHAGITIILFKTGKCRLMGCKTPLITLTNLPYNIHLQCIQSATATYDYGSLINLHSLSIRAHPVMFEPELFPAARLQQFNPLCVNVFASGKIVITGLKTLHIKKIISEICCVLNTSLS